MANKSGAIGTKTETAIVRYLHANGFAGADEMTKAQRLRLKGSDDQGDIGVCPGVMFESKGGHAAEQASDAQIAAWLAETEAERAHRGADIAALIRKRKGKGLGNAGPWWAHLPGAAFYELVLDCLPDAPMDVPVYAAYDLGLPAVQMTLAELVVLLRRAGYGDPLPGAAA